ncbi:MAG: 50S ribosomal protein L5 [Candidatus Peribacteria bacterium]|nr:MAG: 50S ribosomal protein L5 [Candidatus Peribacteria bacterium]
MTLYERVSSEIIPSLQKELKLDNVHQVPRIEKIIVAMGVGSLATRKGVKDFAELQEHMERMTGQKAHMVLSRKSVSNFKLREGMPSMLKTTLRGKKAYDFFERLNMLVLPRVRDYTGISPRKFDKSANLNIGLKQYDLFPEIGPDDMKTPMGLQITIVTSGDDKESVQAFLEKSGMIFQK